MRHGLRFTLATFTLLAAFFLAGAAPAMAQNCTQVSETFINVPGLPAGPPGIPANAVSEVVNCNGEVITQIVPVLGSNGATITGTATGPYGSGSFSFMDNSQFTPTGQQSPAGGAQNGVQTDHFVGTVFGSPVDCVVTSNIVSNPLTNSSTATVTGYSGNCSTLLALRGISGNTAATNKVAAAGRQQRIVVHDILSQPLETENELADQSSETQAESAKAGHMPRIRVFLADATVESDKIAGSTATIGGVTLGTTIEFDNHITIGAMIPLDYMSLATGNATRVGLVGFSQYNWHPESNKAWSIKPTVFFSYIDTIPTGGANVGTFGVGTGLSATYDNGGKFVPGAMGYFSYSKDNTAGPINYQSLFAIGPKLGFRPSGNWVVDVGAMWNKDVSKYITAGTKDYFFDVTTSISYRISRTFKIDFTYDKVLGIDNFRSDQFSIGGRFSF